MSKRKQSEDERSLVILLSGLPATGKSTLARRISKRYNLERISTDSVRKRIFRNVRSNRYSSGSYRFYRRMVVYDTIYYVMYTLLRWNIGCVLDGTYYKESLRSKVKRIADRFDAKFLLIFVECPETLVRQRFKQRSKRKRRTLSDADFDVYLKIKERFEPTKLHHIVINVVKDKEFLMNKIDDAINKLN